MSNDAPPQGGQPAGPAWNDSAADGPYDEPTDPWADTGAPLGPWDTAPGSLNDDARYRYGTAAPLINQPSGPDPTWLASAATPAPPAARSRTGLLIVLVSALAVLAVAGWAVGLYLLKRAPQAGAPVPETSQSETYPAPAPTSAAAGAATAGVGDCLRNTSRTRQPVMEASECKPGSYEVLARVNGTKNYAKTCKGRVKGYEFYYYFDSADDSGDFVLCLRRR